MWRYIYAVVFCIKTITVSSTNTTGAVSSDVCPMYQFKCANEKCIPLLFVCDEANDCGDYSDEKFELCQSRTCNSDQFKCNTGQCIPTDWCCDSENDCPDGFDEGPSTCKGWTCGPLQFACRAKKSQCIALIRMCNDEADCVDGSDEIGCNETCPPNKYSCGNNECIKLSYVCDGDYDCSDGSDEATCPNPNCPRTGQFTCADGLCVSMQSICDKDYDCLDGSDELNCTYPPKQVSPCTASEFQCNDNITCINRTWVCDGTRQCPDGEDESSEICHRNLCSLNHFQCKDQSCISKTFLCDGDEDCYDGSDEFNCTLSKPVCDIKTEFDCGEGICIPLSSVCDKHLDCASIEDESITRCGEDDCAITNGNCTQKCFDSPVGYYCGCESGYKLIQNRTWEDINECLNPGPHSHICINEKGSFICECNVGYTIDPSNRTLCKATEGQPLLLFSKLSCIGKISLSNGKSTVIVNGTKSANAFDYVVSTGTIFWSDDVENNIYKAPIEEGWQRSVVISGKRVISHGLAVDWVYNRLYWTDSIKKHIQMSDMQDKMRKILVEGNLDEPQAIALNPLDGWMYWIDRGDEPKIERSGMDGSHRQTIVSHDIKRPNGLTLDLISERVYWVDVDFNSIFSCNYYGTDRRLILYSSRYLELPYLVTTFEDWIYWTDWSKSAVYRANKVDGTQVRTITETLGNLMAMQFYHPNKQPSGVNYCVNSSCSHLCLPAPQVGPSSPRSSCSCPNGLQLRPDNQTCVEDSVIEKTNTVLEISSSSDNPGNSVTEISSTSSWWNMKLWFISLVGNVNINLLSNLTLLG